MKNKLNKELILQISIILICLFMLGFQFTSKPIQAQEIDCAGQPRPKPSPQREA
jgi:hypothetical protein